MNENVQVVKRLYGAFKERDADALRAVLQDDVEWVQCPGFPGGGHRRGAEEVLTEVFHGLQTEWDGFKVTVEDFLDAGDHVVVLGRYEGTHSRSGQPMVSLFSHTYRIRDGRVATFQQVADTWPMVAATRGEAV